jgi:outer membrane receptor protein involved in Fe transport
MNSTARRAEKKRRSAILFTLAGLLAFGMSGSLQAQLSADEKAQNTRRTSAEKKSSDAAEGEVITLSPFVVTSETERGYQATSTLAGTRIRTPLEDIGTAISVLTSEFLKDTGSNKAVDALVFATGTEVNGLGGNFATYSTTTGSNNKVMVPTTSSSPDTRVRGLASADLTRGYFRTSIPFDSFSIDRIEVNRGSNAVLFGVGSPAGIINYAPKLAQLNRNSGVLRVSADNYGSLRPVQRSRGVVE